MKEYLDLFSNDYLKAQVDKEINPKIVLNDIIEKDYIDTVFQPIVNLETFELVGFEALSRNENLPISKLFKAAREEDLIYQLDRIARKSAIENAIKLNLSSYYLFLNIEPSSLNKIYENELALIKKANKYLNLVLELTEFSMFKNPSNLIKYTQEFRKLGSGIALDDIGKNKYSVALMSFLNPDILKFDLSLIQNELNEETASVVASANACSERKGSVLLAEGIETEEHLFQAKSLGSMLGQGWYFKDKIKLNRNNNYIFKRPAYPYNLELGAYQLLQQHIPSKLANSDLLEEIKDWVIHQANIDNSVTLLILENNNELELLFSSIKEILAKNISLNILIKNSDNINSLKDKYSEYKNLKILSIDKNDPLYLENNIVTISPYFAGAFLSKKHSNKYSFILTYNREWVEAAFNNVLYRIN